MSGPLAVAVIAACRSAPSGGRAVATKENQVNTSLKDYIIIHPLDPDDVAPMSALRAMVKPPKGMARGVDARAPFDAVMERVQPRNGVTFEPDNVGGIPGHGKVSPLPTRPEPQACISSSLPSAPPTDRPVFHTSTALRREFPDVAFHDFASWTSTQDWNALLQNARPS
jgi:hypothetical protein